MTHLFFIAAGGALGALLRYSISNGVHQWLGKDFPYGTLSVNIVGSFFIGVLFILFEQKLALSTHWRLGLITGLLGALTTFSTFSMETITLIENGHISHALINIIGNILCCLLACWLGLWFARTIL